MLGNPLDWLPYGFAVVLWLTGNGAMGMIWIIAYGLGLIPQTESGDVTAAIIATAILGVVREMIASSRRKMTLGG